MNLEALPLRDRLGEAEQPAWRRRGNFDLGSAGVGISVVFIVRANRFGESLLRLVTAHRFQRSRSIQRWNQRQRRRRQATRRPDEFPTHELVAIHATHSHPHVGERGGIEVLFLADRTRESTWRLNVMLCWS
jgi:hypothetical protein